MALIALDLDGTLLDERGRTPDRAVSALRAATASGHRVVIATGRPPHMALPVTSALAGIATHIVGGNGSIISTFPERPDGDTELLHLIGFTMDDAAHVVATLRHADERFGFALASDAGFAHEPGFAALMPAAVSDDPILDVLAIGGTTAFKLLAFHPSNSVHDLLATVPELIAAHPPAAGWDNELDVSHMGADAIEIGPASSDKCAGLIWLCEHLGVDQADVVAIGDEWNDLTMLEWAGRGIAMGNADLRVKAAADQTIGTNRENGVARFIETLM